MASTLLPAVPTPPLPQGAQKESPIVSQYRWRGGVPLASVVVCLVIGLGFFVTEQTVRSASVLVSHWRLNEGTGLTTADSVASRTGRLQNGVAWTAGRSGAAVTMDGVNDYITLPPLEVTGSAITLSAWVRNSSFPSGIHQRFISKAVNSTEPGTCWMLGQANNGQNRLSFRLRTQAVTTTLTASLGTLPLNTWYHAAATYDGNTMRLYLNGAQVASVAKTGTLARCIDVPLHIGRSPEGSNYLRGAIDEVRIYSSTLTSTEIGALVAAGSPTNQPPTVSLSSPASGASFSAGTTIPVSATASDANGTVSRVQFYAGTTLIGTDTSSPYSVSWPNVATGSYTLSAVATDNAGATRTSATRTVTVTSSTPPSSSNQPPSVSMTSPSFGAVFNAPASITLSANASDSGGSVTRVDFYRGTTLIGSDTNSPYSFWWTNVSAGSYSLTAVARDNAGATTVSSTRDITVRPPNMLTTAVFTPSSNHATAVDRYVLEVFPAGADTRVANPVATRDLGRPAITNGEIRADIASTILGLSSGNYVATVTAFGDTGSSQSAASPQFTR